MSLSTLANSHCAKGAFGVIRPLKSLLQVEGRCSVVSWGLRVSGFPCHKGCFMELSLHLNHVFCRRLGRWALGKEDLDPGLLSEFAANYSLKH